MQRGEIMRRSQLLYLALVISILVCCGSDAQSREQPVYCEPPTVRGARRDCRREAMQWAVGLPVYPLVLSAMLDIADAPGVVSAEPAVVCDEPAVV